MDTLCRVTSLLGFLSPEARSWSRLRSADGGEPVLSWHELHIPLVRCLFMAYLRLIGRVHMRPIGRAFVRQPTDLSRMTFQVGSFQDGHGSRNNSIPSPMRRAADPADESTGLQPMMPSSAQGGLSSRIFRRAVRVDVATRLSGLFDRQVVGIPSRSPCLPCCRADPHGQADGHSKAATGPVNLPTRFPPTAEPPCFG